MSIVKKEAQELSEADKVILQQGRDASDVKRAGQAIDAILRETNCYLIPDGNSPLNKIGILIVKQEQPAQPPVAEDNDVKEKVDIDK